MSKDQTTKSTHVHMLLSLTGHQYFLGGHTDVGRWEGNDLVVNSPGVSRMHARLEMSDSGLVIQDLGSTHGTLINGQTIKEKTTLNHGDKITFGHDNHYIFQSYNNLSEPESLASEGREKLPPAWEDADDQSSTTFMNAEDLNLVMQQPAPPTDVFSFTRLVGMVEPFEGIIFPLLDREKTVWKIGRNESADLFINHHKISREHAVLSVNDNVWKLVSTMPTNDILVNGTQKMSCLLQSGDVIQLGDMAFQFKLADT